MLKRTYCGTGFVSGMVMVAVCLLTVTGFSGCGGKKEEAKPGVQGQAQVQVQGQQVQGIPEDSTMLKYGSKEPDIVKNIESLMNSNKLDEAIHALDYFMKREPGNFQYPVRIAVCYQKKGDFVKAKESVQKAISLSPKTSFMYRVYADIYLAEGNHAKAEDALKTAMSLAEDNNNKAYTYSYFANVYMAEKKYSKAKDYIAEGLKLLPNEEHFKALQAQLDAMPKN